MTDELQDGLRTQADSPETKIFVSYSRKDTAEVERIVAGLCRSGGFKVFQDTSDILPTEEWKARLEGLIGEADTVVFCLSPNSTASDVCTWEVGVAERLNKRIAPVVLADTAGEAPGGLAKLNYIFAREKDDFEQAMAALVTALETDIAWVREHTRIGELARRWAANGEPAHQLFRGRDVEDSESWVSYRPSTAPIISEAMIRFIEASRFEEVAAAKKARRVRVTIAVLLVAVIAGFVAFANQRALMEIYTWHITMQPDVLTAVEEQAKADTSGATFTECKYGCPMMIVIPAGKFLMGSPLDYNTNEHPQHEVTITKPFAVAETEVTFAQWDLCVRAGGCPEIGDDGLGREDRPAILMSWEEARQYAAWLSKLTGKMYRLLSASEWEYAAGGPQSEEESLEEFTSKIVEQPQPVAKKKPNAFGLHDMYGNVWEWTEDCWNEDYASKPNDVKATGGPWTTGDCSSREIRGGSQDFQVKAHDLRDPSRDRLVAGDRDLYVGFRLGRTLTP